MIETARWRKAATREQSIALYPGSNPGRASSLRCLPRRSSKSEGWAAQLRLGKAANEPHQLQGDKPSKCRLIGPLRPFRGCGIWSKDHPRARVTWRLG